MIPILVVSLVVAGVLVGYRAGRVDRAARVVDADVTRLLPLWMAERREANPKMRIVR